MTKDEIGKLTLSAIRSDNTLRAIGTSQLGGPAGLMADSILRLLEERERLLEATRRFVTYHSGHVMDGQLAFVQAKARDALALADAPSATAPAGKEEK